MKWFWIDILPSYISVSIFQSFSKCPYLDKGDGNSLTLFWIGQIEVDRFRWRGWYLPNPQVDSFIITLPLMAGYPINELSFMRSSLNCHFYCNEVSSATLFLCLFHGDPGCDDRNVPLWSHSGQTGDAGMNKRCPDDNLVWERGSGIILPPLVPAPYLPLLVRVMVVVVMMMIMVYCDDGDGGAAEDDDNDGKCWWRWYLWWWWWW